MNPNLLLLCIIIIACSCGGAREKRPTANKRVDTALKFDPNAPSGTKMEREAQLSALVNISRQAMDSIDVAYTSVRSSSRLMNLSMEEREDLNEALQQMNVAKELIVLQTQREIIDQLREKTNSLNAVIDHINKTSDKLNNIATTIPRVTHIIEGTTNMLASAFSAGIIKPKSGRAQN